MATLVIPARYASKRLPGKLLLAETGRPLIAHVIDRARRARRVSRVLVATDDARIRDAAREAGVEGVISTSAHTCGTERVAEVAESMPGERFFVNLQGDEPEIEPESIDLLVETIESARTPMAILAAPLRDEAGLRDPAVVKVVLRADGEALYFSRSPIPFDRDGKGAARPLHHLGLYAYSREALLQFAALEPSPLERTERLEQLRALENGIRIRVRVVDEAPPGIDTMEAYRAFVARRLEGASPEDRS